MTEWRRISRSPYRSYEVSLDGDVRRAGRTLTGYVDRYGYRTVLLSYAGLSRRFKVHRLVCEAFHGGCPDACEAAHLDGNPLNNRADNLAWVTHSENVRHAVKHGTFRHNQPPKEAMRRGETHPHARLSDAQVAEIRRRVGAGESGRSLARAFGVTQPHISKLARGIARSLEEASPEPKIQQSGDSR